MSKLVLLLLLISSFAYAQEGIPAKPNGYILDEAGLLNPEEENALEQKMRGYADSTSTQFAIVLVNITITLGWLWCNGSEEKTGKVDEDSD